MNHFHFEGLKFHINYIWGTISVIFLYRKYSLVGNPPDATFLKLNAGGFSKAGAQEAQPTAWLRLGRLERDFTLQFNKKFSPILLLNLTLKSLLI
ncbi:unnamed protein product [Coffea canephora]|uniref:Uncharacterized protein n=1 Tax=Coffea canephora TaxID=49390 RepID=A0A068V1V9_COFCA|nr:unnamed protein product [Coffea canephora]